MLMLPKYLLWGEIKGYGTFSSINPSIAQKTRVFTSVFCYSLIVVLSYYISCPAQNKHILLFYLIQRISRDSAHEITHIKRTIYIHSVSHGLNVDNEFPKNSIKVNIFDQIALNSLISTIIYHRMGRYF